MKNIKVPLAKPYFEEDDIDFFQEACKTILKSGQLTLGPFLKKFEESLMKFTGAKFAVAMNSATSVLHAAMVALDVKQGDKVLVPAYTFASTVNAPLYVGAKPILVDSDLKNFNMSFEDLEEKISRYKPKAIIPVHIAGIPLNMELLIEMVENIRISIVEDAAHALGCFFGEQHCGTFGRIGVLSFYPNKIITTGEGGAALTNNENIAKKLRLLRSVGREALGPSDVKILGFNFRMSELNAALGLTQMRKLPFILRRRREIAEYYSNLIRKNLNDIIEPQDVPKNSVPSYYAYIVRIKTPYLNRDKLRGILYTDFGIETTILYKPIHTLSYYKRIFKNSKLPNAELLGKTTLALPIHPYMTEKTVEYVIHSLEESINRALKR